MDELVDKIIKWGREKNIDNPFGQFAKINEEVGEIAHELTRGNFDSAELQDAIGDTLVTVIILSDILGFDPYECLSEAYKVISDRKGVSKDGVFIKNE